MASLLGHMVGKPGEEVAAGRAAVVDALRDAMGGFLSADLEELIRQGRTTGFLPQDRQEWYAKLCFTLP